MIDSGLTEFNEGGTHEESPIGGIPQGVHPDGTPNYVEEGETKLSIAGQKYVFSNRLNVAKKHIEAKGLPSYLEGKTFAEASKEITKRFKDRQDNASMSTQMAFLDRLVEMQEVVKLEGEAEAAGMSVEDYMAAQAAAELQEAEAQVEEQAASQAQGVEQEMQQGAPEQTQFALGGEIGASSISGGLDIVGALMQDQKSDKEVRDKISVGGNTAKYAAMGAAVGSVVPGLGTAIGAGVGGALGAGSAILSNNKIAGEKQDAMMSQQGKKLLADGYRAAYGGSLDIFGEDPTPKFRFGNDFLSQPSITDGVGETDAPEEDKPSNLLGIGALGASLAPFVGNLIEGSNLEQADPIRYHRTGRTYIPEFADEQGMLNIVDDSFASAPDAIAAASAGNLGSYRANLLGSNINKSKMRSAAFDKINDINRGERKLLNQDAARAAEEETLLANKELEASALDRAAYEDAKAAYRAAAYEGLGKLGETIFQTSQQKGLSPYNIFGGRKKQDEA